jgi:hypothetical protein
MIENHVPSSLKGDVIIILTSQRQIEGLIRGVITTFLRSCLLIYSAHGVEESWVEVPTAEEE